jgi:hypothetical protein
LSAGLVPDGDAGSFSPSSGRKVSGARGRAFGDGRGQAASAGQVEGPEATSGSQLVPWTTRE